MTNITRSEGNTLALINENDAPTITDRPVRNGKWNVLWVVPGVPKGKASSAQTEGAYRIPLTIAANATGVTDGVLPAGSLLAWNAAADAYGPKGPTYSGATLGKTYHAAYADGERQDTWIKLFNDE